jgi:ADP-L-glycero-D-manno-heptose 6-epimerase
MIYITGAEGFIASHLIEKISQNESNKLICCDIKNSDLVQPENIFQLMEQNKPSIIFHMGAISSTTETNVSHLAKNNILFSCQLLEYCISNSIPFIYASSASVYGHGAHGFKENSQMEPLNYYAMSKAAFDLMVEQKIKDYPQSKIYGLRFFNVYGNYEHKKGEMASPIYKFIKSAKEKKEIKIFEGSSKHLRDFIHVDDVVDIIIAAKDFKNSGIYNVGTQQSKSFLEVASIISGETDAQIIEIPFPDYLKNKYQKYTCSDNFKINFEYSSNRITLEDGIKKVLNKWIK